MSRAEVRQQLTGGTAPDIDTLRANRVPLIDTAGDRRDADLASRQANVRRNAAARAVGLNPEIFESWQNMSPEGREQVTVDALTPRAVSVSPRGWSSTPTYRPPEEPDNSLEAVLRQQAMAQLTQQREEAEMVPIRVRVRSYVGSSATPELDAQRALEDIESKGMPPARAEQVVREVFPNWSGQRRRPWNAETPQPGPPAPAVPPGATPGGGRLPL
jgi:hypothetical protein